MWWYENGFLANIDQSKKKKRESERQRSTQLAKLSPEWGGSEIIKLYCQSEERWRAGVTLQSERCTVAEHSRGERRVWSHSGWTAHSVRSSSASFFVLFKNLCKFYLFYFWCDTFSCACLICFCFGFFPSFSIISFDNQWRAKGMQYCSHCKF